MGESDWSAWYNKEMPKQDPKLHVSGTVGVNNETDEVTLEVVAGGSGDPSKAGEELVLRVVVTPAQIGLPVLSQKPVDWAQDVGPGVKTVQIQDVDGQTYTIEVDHAT